MGRYKAPTGLYITYTVGRVSIAYFNDCELQFFSELAIRNHYRTQCIDYAGVANTQHAQIAIFKFAIYLKKPETQLFYYAIKTRPTVDLNLAVCMLDAWENDL